MLHIREAVGGAIMLRADANQKWSLSQSLQFGHAVKGAGLQVGLGCMRHRVIAKPPPQAHETAVQLCQNLCLVSASSGELCPLNECCPTVHAWVCRSS